MSAFTDSELTYLSGQQLGRIATAQASGTLQVSPVGFHHNAELDTIDISGHGMATSRKYRNALSASASTRRSRHHMTSRSTPAMSDNRPKESDQ
jgi:PPOX class F420-dependent enzyme/OxyR family protein